MQHWKSWLLRIVRFVVYHTTSDLLRNIPPGNCSYMNVGKRLSTLTIRAEMRVDNFSDNCSKYSSIPDSFANFRTIRISMDVFTCQLCVNCLTVPHTYYSYQLVQLLSVYLYREAFVSGS